MTPPTSAQAETVVTPWSGQGDSFTSTENQDGSFGNPVIGADVPDVSTIRVSAEEAGEPRDVYYMVSTTMELAPGAPILKSYDLVNWEIATYVYDVLETDDRSALRNGNSAYGQGQWASTIAFHDGTYYVLFNSNNNGHSYLFSTDDIEDGEWARHSYTQSFHDPSLFFDDANDGAAYIFYGYGSTSVVKLSSDLTTVTDTYPSVIAAANYVNASGYTNSEVGTSWEGIQVYYANGYYYALGITWAKFGRQAIVFRSKSLLGNAVGDPYAVQIAVGTNSIAQGGFIGTGTPGTPPNYALLFRDDYPTGRIPVLVPVDWTEGDPDAWPTFGNGTVGPGQVGLPGDLPMPVELPADEQRRAMSSSVVTSEDFINAATPESPAFNDAEGASNPVAQRALAVAVGTDIVENGDFEGESAWTVNDPATLAVTSDPAASGNNALKVTDRTMTGSGPMQSLAGKVAAGKTYNISYKIYYDDPDAAATQNFFATAIYPGTVADTDGTGQNARIVNLKGGTATKGQWTTVAGTFTVGANRTDLSKFDVFLETPWKPSPIAADLLDYYVDDVVITEAGGDGTNMVVDGDFEAGGSTAGWESREGAVIGTSADAGNGAFAASVTGRTSTGSGIQQILPVEAGSTYDISFMVKYTEPTAASTVRYIASVDYGSNTGGSQWVNLTGGNATKGEWSTISGSFTAPTARDLSHFQVYIENSYSSSPTAATRPDFLLDNVKVVKTMDGTPVETHDPAEEADNGSALALPWQWNHNPDNRYWSLTDREGWLRLTTGHLVTGTATSQFRLTRFEEARNTLTQRTFAPIASAETRMDVSGMQDGDTAGLAVYNRQVSYIAVRQDGSERTLGVVSRPATTYADSNPAIAGAEDFLASVALPDGTEEVYIKADLDLRTSGATKNTVQFLYSLDGVTWQNLGGANAKLAQWESSHFKGQRFGLFNYATETLGGQVDFDYYYLSDTLTSQAAPIDRGDLDWLVVEAEGLDEADYTAESWVAVPNALAAAKAVTVPSTQNQVDAPAQALNRAIASLVKVDDPDPEPVETSVSVAAASMVYGQAGSLKVAVMGADEGMVSAVVGGRTVSASVDAAGRAVLPLAEGSLVPGAHKVAVSYAGTEEFAPSAGTGRVSVAKAVASVVVSGPTTVKAGTAVTFDVRVSAVGVTPSGTVKVSVAGVRAKAVTASLKDGTVTVTVQVPTGAKAGSKKVTVAYQGSVYVSTAKATMTLKVTR